MRFNVFAAAVGMLPLALGYDYGFWNVTVSQGWPASGYRYWNLDAEYSATPGVITHTTWLYSPADGSTITYHNDTNFGSTYNSGDGSISLVQSVFLTNGDAVDVVGQGTINCKINPASGRSCSGSTIVDAACVGERCL
ncbi:hypothetical protein SAMD00023353_6300280 [Rosellinia necatrix]|uniref:Uncharacterized protein n=1 Tax=Rosellinia necatrix TaxID=77044 RepID=A0A1W2TS86_ROSNE|nr:hypothetical protein SAMD00023353_6300280 [Rosellinia necatrix]